MENADAQSWRVCDPTATYYTLQRLVVAAAASTNDGVAGVVPACREVCALTRCSGLGYRVGVDVLVELRFAEVTTDDNIIWQGRGPTAVKEVIDEGAGAAMYMNTGGVCFPARRGGPLPWTIKFTGTDTTFQWTDKSFSQSRTVVVAADGTVKRDEITHALLPVTPRPMSSFLVPKAVVG